MMMHGLANVKPEFTSEHLCQLFHLHSIRILYLVFYWAVRSHIHSATTGKVPWT